MAVERFAAAENVELHRFELGEVGSIENVVDVVERDRFPNVHADEDVAATDTLLRGRAVGANVGHGQTPAISRAVGLELTLRNRVEPQAEHVPGTIRRFDRRTVGQRGDGELYGL